MAKRTYNFDTAELLAAPCFLPVWRKHDPEARDVYQAILDQMMATTGYYLVLVQELPNIAKAANVHVSVAAEIIGHMVDAGVFDINLYHYTGVLTSSEIQRRYRAAGRAISHRQVLPLGSPYCLINPGRVKGTEKGAEKGAGNSAKKGAENSAEKGAEKGAKNGADLPGGAEMGAETGAGNSAKKGAENSAEKGAEMGADLPGGAEMGAEKGAVDNNNYILNNNKYNNILSSRDGEEKEIRDRGTGKGERESQGEGMEHPTATADYQALKYPADSFEIKASAYLRDRILAILPKARVPRDAAGLQRWAVHVDRLRRLDGRSEDEIRRVIRFATTDSFWQTNILSTKTLREKFDTLYAQMWRKSPGDKPRQDAQTGPETVKPKRSYYDALNERFDAEMAEIERVARENGWDGH